jgi:hypothetical protein
MRRTATRAGFLKKIQEALGGSIAVEQGSTPWLWRSAARSRPHEADHAKRFRMVHRSRTGIRRESRKNRDRTRHPCRDSRLEERFRASRNGGPSTARRARRWNRRGTVTPKSSAFPPHFDARQLDKINEVRSRQLAEHPADPLSTAFELSLGFEGITRPSSAAQAAGDVSLTNRATRFLSSWGASGEESSNAPRCSSSAVPRRAIR